MPKLLYITPYFPPQRRVGAMRPMRFVRHLREFGWDPVVLCDVSKDAEAGATNLVPEGIEVVYNYSSRAGKAHRDGRSRRRSARPRTSPVDRLLRVLPKSLSNPELIPLGEHSRHVFHATRAGAELCRRHRFDAIVVNADPWAALLVGTFLSKKFNVPLVADLRDPWAPCELRRPMRPRLIRRLVDKLERSVIEQASCVILNTQTARQAYWDHYPDVPQSRFAVVRNSSDPVLIREDRQHLDAGTFTMLFLGTLRPAVDGEALLALVEELKRRGVSSDALHLVVTAGLPDAVVRSAHRRGISDFLKHGEHVAYSALHSVMQAADLLVLQGHETDQRIPAKLYDYLMADRPILALARNPELGEILRDTGAGECFALDDVERAADFVTAHMARGRLPCTPRHNLEHYTARGTTRQFVELLTRVRGRIESGGHGRGT